MKNRQQYKTVEAMRRDRDLRQVYSQYHHKTPIAQRLECFEYQLFLFNIGAIRYFCKVDRRPIMQRAQIVVSLLHAVNSFANLLTK